MEMNDLILVSTDDHVVEPPDMFAGRIPAKYADRAPRVIGDSNGNFNWMFDGQAAPSLTTSATVGRADGEHDEPSSYDDVRPGVYNIHERVKDMNVNGVLGSLCFPSFPRFAGQLFQRSAAKDADLALTVLQAYNDWHIEDWCGTYPGRFIPCAVTPLWDPTAMGAEVRRVNAMGCHAVTFSMNPYLLGLPSLHDPHWDPFWAACDETETIVCMHTGSNSSMIQTSPDAPHLVMTTCAGINIYPTAADLVWSEVLRKFPRIMFALSEGEIGWVPHFLERADYVYEHHISWRPDHPFYGELPSDRFKRRIVTCFIDDPHGVRSLDVMNVDNVTWECDYPHPDSNWPRSPEVTWESLQHVPDEDTINKVTHLNAMRIFRFDPFAHRSARESTVGALRELAIGHDTSFIPGRQTDLAVRTSASMQAVVN